MCPFSVTVQHVPDRELGPLLTRLAEAGFDNPIIDHVGAEGATAKTAAPARGGTSGPPGGLAPRAGAGGRVISVAQRARSLQALPRVHGHDARRRRRPGRAWRDHPQEQVGPRPKVRRGLPERGSPQQPLVEFVAADDYEQTRELVAVIRGSDGGRRMYGVGDALPAVYAERFRTQIYNERVVHPGAWNKIVVVAREDDDEAMLNHALIQSRRRYRT